VHVWIRNELGEYLIQQRALHLPKYPGIWATTAGYVIAGESSIHGAIRETQEELGLHLQPGQCRLFNQLKMKIQLEDIWLADVSRALVGVPQIGPEVAGWQWASKPQISQMIRESEFFAYSYFDSLPE
jgi:isopentenyldiphosphate isomerase